VYHVSSSFTIVSGGNDGKQASMVEGIENRRWDEFVRDELRIYP